MSSWKPETTNWAKELLVWAEQQAQEQSRASEENSPIDLRNARSRRDSHVAGGSIPSDDDADVAYWAYSIREMLKDIHWEAEGVEHATLIG